MRHLPLFVASLALLLTMGALASAQGVLKDRAYHFGTHPARTNVTFVSEADLETIHGITHAIQGKVSIDAAGVASGTLRIDVSKMKTGIDLRDEHMRSDQWLDAARYPRIDLVLQKAVQNEDGKTWAYAGRLTIKGVTKAVKGSARITAFPDAIGKALGDGSWVRVRTTLDIALSDFGIQVPTAIGAKVNNAWKVGVDIYGTTAAPKRSGR